MKKFLMAIILASITVSAYAIFGSLVEQKTNGALKYCKYSNGVIITVNNYELCPISIQ